MSEDLHAEAVQHWGLQAQSDMSLEEAAEVIEAVARLQKAIIHHRRGRISLDAVAEEIGDLEIMLSQVKIGLNIVEAVDASKAKKNDRISQRLAKSKANFIAGAYWEVVGPNGVVHYRRQAGDMLLREALKAPGYWLRRVARGAN